MFIINRCRFLLLIVITFSNCVYCEICFGRVKYIHKTNTGVNSMCVMQNPVSAINSSGTFNHISAYFLGAILSGNESYRLYTSEKRVWLASVKHNIGYCTTEQLNMHMQSLSKLAATTNGRVYSKAELTSRNWFTPNKQGFAIGFECDNDVSFDSICDYAEECIPRLSAEEKLCVLRGAFDGRSSIDINKMTNDLRYIVLDCGNDRAMDILAKLLREVGIRHNCNYARERLEGGEPRKPQLRVAAGSGYLFAHLIGYISPARLAILQRVFGNGYVQQEADEVLYGLKLLIRKDSYQNIQISSNVSHKDMLTRVPNRTDAPESQTRKETQSVSTLEIPSITLGETVIHRVFGFGTVIYIEANKYLEIDFSGTIRKFQHPQAFVAGFLKKE